MTGVEIMSRRGRWLRLGETRGRDGERSGWEMRYQEREGEVVVRR